MHSDSSRPKYPLVLEELRFSTPLPFVVNFSQGKVLLCCLKTEVIN